MPQENVNETLGQTLYIRYVEVSVVHGESIGLFVPWASLHPDHKLRWERTAKAFLETANLTQ